LTEAGLAGLVGLRLQPLFEGATSLVGQNGKGDQVASTA
jgi:hypothetical protein